MVRRRKITLWPVILSLVLLRSSSAIGTTTPWSPTLPTAQDGGSTKAVDAAASRSSVVEVDCARYKFVSSNEDRANDNTDACFNSTVWTDASEHRVMQTGSVAVNFVNQHRFIFAFQPRHASCRHAVVAVKISSLYPPHKPVASVIKYDRQVAPNDELFCFQLTEATPRGELFVRGETVGLAEMPIGVYREGDDADTLVKTNTFNVQLQSNKQLNAADKVFDIVVMCFIVVGNVVVGLQIDLQVVRRTLWPPIAPSIGFCCQFIIMPLIAFAVARLTSDLLGPMTVGMMAMGCSPGGGGSNYHTFFLGGDVSLSITMTFISTMAAFFMMPLWISLLAPKVLAPELGQLMVPFKTIFKTLLIAVVPFGLAIVIQIFLPKPATFISKYIAKPFLAIAMVMLIVAAGFSKLYVFDTVPPLYVLFAAALPYCGFLAGFLIALICRQKKKVAITIAVETGMQNAVIAMAIVSGLERPISDLAIAGPVIIACLTPMPLLVIEVIRAVWIRCHPREKDDDIADPMDNMDAFAGRDDEPLPVLTPDDGNRHGDDSDSDDAEGRPFVSPHGNELFPNGGGGKKSLANEFQRAAQAPLSPGYGRVPSVYTPSSENVEGAGVKC